MNIKEVVSYVLIAFLLLLSSALIGVTGLWTQTLTGSLSWFCQVIGIGLLIVSGTCVLCQRPLRELSPWTIFWIVLSAGFIMLASIIVKAAGTSADLVWPELGEFTLSVGILIMLFTLPRSFYYD
jgi:hypothetical protein